MKLNFRPLPVFGAQITNWNFDKYPNHKAVRAIRQAVLKHKLLLIRGVCLEPEQLRAFAQMFGHQLFVGSPLFRHSEEFKEVFRLTNQPTQGNDACACESWHCDGHYMPDPCGITCTHMIQPGDDGAISISDLSRAYDILPENAKVGFRRLGMLNSCTGVAHPLVIKHPATGRESLYINRYADTIDRKGNKYPHVDLVLDKLLSDQRVFYKHHWQKGDLIILDNFSVVHKVCPSNPEREEITIRSQTTASSTWWNKKVVTAPSAVPSQLVKCAS